MHCLDAFSKCHRVYFSLVLAVLLSALGVSVNIFSNQKIVHVLVNVFPHGWDRDDHVLLPLNGYPDVLRIDALAPSITHQGLRGSSGFLGLGYYPHIIYVTHQVLG